MHRFSVLAVSLPHMAITAMLEKVDAWWNDFLRTWHDMFVREAYDEWRNAQRAETLDADSISQGFGGTGFAAGCGGDE
jgi:hypothetical protein